MPLTRPTTTPLPDEIYDVWVPVLGAAELKVLLYIVRRTLGFGKSADAISLTQFTHGIVTADGRVLDHGCGVRNRSNVVGALKGLEARELIRAVPAQTSRGDRAVTIYALWWEDDDDNKGSAETAPGGGPPEGPGWSCSEQKVVPEEDYGSAAARPTTNSKTRNRQQDSGTTTRVRARPPSAEKTHHCSLNSPEGIWHAVLDEVGPLLTPENYQRWLAQTRAVGQEGDALQVAVPDALHAFWLDTRLRRLLDDTLQRLGFSDLHISPVVTD